MCKWRCWVGGWVNKQSTSQQTEHPSQEAIKEQHSKPRKSRRKIGWAEIDGAETSDREDWEHQKLILWKAEKQKRTLKS